MAIKPRMVPYNPSRKGKLDENDRVSESIKPKATFSGGGGVTNIDLKKMGRNLAKIKNQEKG